MFVSDCYNVNEKGHLTISGCDTVELAEKYGTALYVMSEDEIRSVCRRYKSSFERHYNGNGTALYASKAFCCKEICRIVTEEGLDLDVVSGGELYTALAAGVDAKHIHFHGNNKTMQELRYALESGVGDIVVDNLNELHRIEKLSAEKGVVTSISMRIKPGIDAHTHEFIRTGQIDSKFGFALENGEAFEAVKEAVACENVELIGLHCHIGSQIFALHSYPEAVEVMVELMARIEEGYGYRIEELDVGGGLGIAYTADDKPASIDEFAETVTSAVHAACEKFGVPEPRLLTEPGRSLVATAGVTLYTVGILKTLPGIRKYVAVDGGMSDNIRTALYHADYEPVIANKAGQPRTEIVTIAGKHCESGDAVVIDMPMQHPDLGDIVAVFGTGAYCYTMASNYNGQPRPAIVFVKDGQARVTTRRETYEDLMSRDI